MLSQKDYNRQKEKNNTVEFNEEVYRRFVKKYEDTVKNKRQSFMFGETEVLCDYAKYVIEYLKPKFNKG